MAAASTGISSFFSTTSGIAMLSIACLLFAVLCCLALYIAFIRRKSGREKLLFVHPLGLPPPPVPAETGAKVFNPLHKEPLSTSTVRLPGPAAGGGVLPSLVLSRGKSSSSISLPPNPSSASSEVEESVISMTQNPLLKVWVKKWSEKKGAPYFINKTTKQSVWVLPEGAEVEGRG